MRSISFFLWDRIGSDWIGSDWIGLDWIGLDWIGLDWIGLDWIGLDGVGWGVLREWELHYLVVCLFISLFSYYLVNLLEVLLHISFCVVYKCFFFLSLWLKISC